jgi:hypothetical protein
MGKIKIDRQNNQMSQMAGEIHTNIDIGQFASILIDLGIRTKLHASSFYTGGTYIRIEEGATEFFLENIGEEYLATGQASSGDRMYQAAKKVSEVLIMLDINHAFEIYNGSTELVYYLHHNLPQ